MTFLVTTLLAQTDIGGNLEGLGAYQPGAEGAGAETKITSLFSNIVGFFTVVAGVMFLLYFVLGALNWIMAGGDAQNVEKAKKMMTDAAIGLIIVVTAYAIAAIVGGVLGFQILNPAAELQKLRVGGGN